MRVLPPRRLVLLLLAFTVAIGLVVPGVWHDTEQQGLNPYDRNRLTGDVTIRAHASPSFWSCLQHRRPARSVFGD